MNYSELLEKAVLGTISAGEEVWRQYKEGFETQVKKDNSPVTSADFAAHDILSEHLSATNLPIISEEGEKFSHEERQSFDAYWMLDPIDGTRDFINKTDEFCICTGLIAGNTAKLGVLYAPALNLFYFGAEGYSSRKIQASVEELVALAKEKNILEALEKKSVFLPSFSPKEKYTFLTSRFHRDNGTDFYIKELKKEHPDLEVVTMGCAIKMGLIADRYATEYTRFLPVNFWDVAAGHAIAKYAGRKVTGANNDKEIDYSDKNMRVHGYSVKWSD